MNMILKISTRNLIRQKRRNILLGIGIAFGICILVVANGFSQGISDILLNKVIVWITGHIRVAITEKDEREWKIIRDKERIKKIIREQIPGEIVIFEDVAAGGRAIGNKSVETIYMKGVELNEGFFREIQTEAGPDRILAEDITNPNIENPIIIYNSLAEESNVKVNDTFRVGFQTVYNQMETAKFTVVAILKKGMPLLDMAAFTHINTLKPLLGYKEHETGALNVILKNLKNPDIVLEQAKRLHEALQPGVAGYESLLRGNGKEEKVRIFAMNSDSKSRSLFSSRLQIIEGALWETQTGRKTPASENDVLLGQALAGKLGVRIGDQITSAYDTRFEGESPARNYRVGAIFQSNDAVASDIVFVNAGEFNRTFFPSPPKHPAYIDRNNMLFPLLVKEWTLLERSRDQESSQKKYDELAYNDWRGSALDVQTMYELGSDVLRLELVLNIVTLGAVLILFFIILIGVVNTLRMTIRERTREIGTVRAIGMQQADVRWIFITEILLLALSSGIVGLGFGHIVMKLLGLVPVKAEGIFVILLVDDHLHFVPTLFDSIKNLLIITVITFTTAYFPSRKAAKLSVAAALRHYE